MSNMLEQAIVDAKSLREAAMKSAEAEVVEKYSEEVKEAVSKLLEQDEEFDLGAEDLGAEEEEMESTALEQVPMAHVPSMEGEEEIVEVDLDDIIAAAQTEEGEEEFELDREEIADEVGLDLSPDEPVAPANRSDEEIDLDEGELVNLFKELLVIDVPAAEVASASEEEVPEDKVEVDEDVAIERVDGMDKDDIEEYREVEEQNEALRKQNKKLTSLLERLKNKLEELNVQNARLLYTNRVYENPSLNERQKNKIAEMVSKSRSVDEARVIFETLQKTMANVLEKNAPQSLSEAVTKSSSVVLSGRREQQVSEKNPTKDRWAVLAGLKNN